MTYGQTYRCAGCGEEGVAGEDLEEQYDRYGIYAGMFHDTPEKPCWKNSGMAEFVFDPAYAGERLEEDY